MPDGSHPRAGKLTRAGLMPSRSGKIVSKRRSEAASKRYHESGSSLRQFNAAGKLAMGYGEPPRSPYAEDEDMPASPYTSPHTSPYASPYASQPAIPLDINPHAPKTSKRATKTTRSSEFEYPAVTRASRPKKSKKGKKKGKPKSKQTGA